MPLQAAPVPVVISSSFSERTGYTAGDFTIISTLDRLIPVAIRGEVDLFPTMHPADFGFVVADLDSTLRHLNILSPLASIVPNEMLMSEAPGAEAQLVTHCSICRPDRSSGTGAVRWSR